MYVFLHLSVSWLLCRMHQSLQALGLPCSIPRGSSPSRIILPFCVPHASLIFHTAYSVTIINSPLSSLVVAVVSSLSFLSPLCSDNNEAPTTPHEKNRMNKLRYSKPQLLLMIFEMSYEVYSILSI